jgi:5-oxoprolinase (ATP-hydrolysing)
MAASQCTMNNFTFGNAKYQYYETISGGSGAGEGFDGTSVVQTHMTNSRLTDPEVLEFRFPVRLESYAIRKGSGGAGKWKGGDGGVRRVRFLEPMTASILSNGRKHGAFGMAGGKPGAVGINRVVRADGPSEELDHIGQAEMQPGTSSRSTRRAAAGSAGNAPMKKARMCGPFFVQRGDYFLALAASFFASALASFFSSFAAALVSFLSSFLVAAAAL